MGLVNFFHPETLEEAKTLVNKYKGTKVLAGGTDLMLNLIRGEENCDYIVSLENLKGLKDIIDQGEEIRIGSMVTFTDLIYSQIIRDNFNSLINCSETMGSPQIRNAATVGGNIINAGSAADAVPCIISLHGVLVFENLEGVRKVTCEDYFNNYSDKKIKSDEILTGILIPKTKASTGYYKLGKRNALAIARISCAVSIELEEGMVMEARICLGAVGRHPFRAVDLEKATFLKKVQWLSSEESLSYLSAEVERSIGGRKTMPFKREAIKGVFKEALKAALKKESPKVVSGERS